LRQKAIKEAGAAPATPRKPSIQVSEPVSREAPAMSGNRQPSDWNTLSPEEVDIARRSIIDRPDMPRMTNAEKSGPTCNSGIATDALLLEEQRKTSALVSISHFDPQQT
jgi:hypothetical protein